LFRFRIIRRTVNLISIQASLLAQKEAAMSQATSASDTARRLMSEQSGKKESNDKTDKENNAKVTLLETEVNTMKEG